MSDVRNWPHEQTGTRTHITVMLDTHEKGWAQFRNSRGIASSLQDFPEPLQARLRRVVETLCSHKIAKLEFDARRTQRFSANGHAYSEHLLGITDLEHLLGLAQWWMYKEQTRKRCLPRFDKKHPFKTWTCECGDVVPWNHNLCKNLQCPSRDKMKECTGISTLKIAKSA